MTVEIEPISLEESSKNRRGGVKVQGGGMVKKRKLENGEVAWGEALSKSEVDRQAFLKAEATGPKNIGVKQSRISVMTGVEWQAYVLVKELVWESVDKAWGVDEVAKWNECDMPVPDGNGSGQHVVHAGHSDPTLPVMGEQGMEVSGNMNGEMVEEPRKTLKKEKSKRCKKLPGVSANQKSVAEFFVTVC